MNLPRSSGVQLHPTSLPGRRLGPEAHAFVDWLADAGQSWWQMLPLGPPDRHASPYKAQSAFAAWPGLLAEPDAPVSRAEELDFRERHAAWIETWIGYAGDGAVADQVRFEREWSRLREHAEARGIRLIGDVPIYVAPGSADHRAHPEYFKPGVQAGVPPDAFTDKGQLWGNPIYDWKVLARERYGWWAHRMDRMLQLFDVVRVDHFRGFESYWAVDADAEDASGGRWEPGPGRAVFDAVTQALGRPLPVIAEDLGVITKEVEALRDALGYPGMAVLQFGFDPADPDGTHDLHRHREHQVAYTGTHDNDTVVGWFASLPAKKRDAVLEALDDRGIEDTTPQWALIRLLFTSVASVAMVQLQDVLGLGSEARMNMPGTKGGQWQWRLEPAQLTRGHAARLRAAMAAAGRVAASA
jgi:4-alpha-glucanotransferase